MKNVVSILIVLSMVITILPFSANAYSQPEIGSRPEFPPLSVSYPSGLYETTKDNVPVWTHPKSTGESRQVRRITNKGATVNIISTERNSAGNVWGKTDDGNYIYISAKNGDVGNLRIHNHSFRNGGKDVDECLCGFIRFHEALTPLFFITAKDNVPIWSEPNSSSTRERTINNQGTRIMITARLINKHGNHWGRTNTGDFVYMENLIYDLDAQLSDSINSFNLIGRDIIFINNVREGGIWDFKLSLNYERDYKVRVGGRIQDDILTGEQIGNIHYGYVGSVVFTKEALLLGGGGVNALNVLWNNLIPSSKTKDELVNLAVNCVLYWCDEPDDNISINRGIDYYNTGRWR